MTKLSSSEIKGIESVRYFAKICESQWCKPILPWIIRGYEPTEDSPRTYHNIFHIETVCRHIPTDAAPELMLAALAHDIVYVPMSKDSEERSCLAIQEFLGVEIPLVTKYILATKHDSTETDRNSQILCDADLAVLGGSWEEYQRYVMAVRQEFDVPDSDWRKGRSDWITSVLQKDQIYYRLTDLESPARSNLQKELAYLSES